VTIIHAPDAGARISVRLPSFRWYQIHFGPGRTAALNHPWNTIGRVQPRLSGLKVDRFLAQYELAYKAVSLKPQARNHVVEASISTKGIEFRVELYRESKGDSLI
jgi:hypothetical protein